MEETTVFLKIDIDNAKLKSIIDIVSGLEGVSSIKPVTDIDAFELFIVTDDPSYGLEENKVFLTEEAAEEYKDKKNEEIECENKEKGYEVYSIGAQLWGD